MCQPNITDGAIVSFLNYQTGTALDLAGGGRVSYLLSTTRVHAKMN
jgi:hypothetical protein